MVAFAFSRVLTIAAPSSGIILSALSGCDAPSARRVHDVSLRVTILSLALMVVFGELLGPKLLVLLSTAANSPRRSRRCEILTLQSALARVADLTAQLFSAANKPEINSIAGTVEITIVVMLILILTRDYGAAGGALALLIGTTARVSVLWGALGPCLGHPLPRLWLNGADIRELKARLS